MVVLGEALATTEEFEVLFLWALSVCGVCGGRSSVIINHKSTYLSGYRTT